MTFILFHAVQNPAKIGTVIRINIAAVCINPLPPNGDPVQGIPTIFELNTDMCPSRTDSHVGTQSCLSLIYSTDNHCVYCDSDKDLVLTTSP